MRCQVRGGSSKDMRHALLVLWGKQPLVSLAGHSMGLSVHKFLPRPWVLPAAACSDCARCSRVWCGSAGARVNGCSGRGEILVR